MSNEERAAIVNLIREYVKALADIEALQSILTLERREGRVADNWKDDLAEIRSSKKYTARVEEAEPGIAQIDGALAEDVRREDDDLMQLIERLPGHRA